MGADLEGMADVEVMVAAWADLQGRYGILRAPVREDDHLPALRYLLYLSDHHGMSGDGPHASLFNVSALYADQWERIDEPELKNVSLLDEYGRGIIPTSWLAGFGLEAGRMARIESQPGGTVPVRPLRKEVLRVQD